MEHSQPATGKWRVSLLYVVTLLLTAALAFGIALFLQNIRERKAEGREHFVQVVELNEDTTDPAVWGQNFPREYDGYKRTADNERGGAGGSEGLPPSRLEADPRLKRIFAGYAFSVDYREKRGHAFMLIDQEQTERIKQFKQPGACLHCHASIIPAYRFAGDGDVQKGFEKVCAMPYWQAHDLANKDGTKLVSHPVSCIDCHDPKTVQLRVSRPAFLNAIRDLAESDYDLPHLSSIMRWRREHKQSETYDPNTMATRQEMRSFVCGQCHVEYYFRGDGKTVTYPWKKGLRVEQMEAYYDETGFKDYVHAETKAPILKAQHPEFEMWNQGIHARSGVACADCHMPYMREGAVKISDHRVRSPMLNSAHACQVCHHYSEEEIMGRVTAIQDRTKALVGRSEDALLQMMDAIKTAEAKGVSAEKLTAARALHRKAQWRLDIVASENSHGFHAPQESARILAEAIDYARQAQITVLAPEKP
jgi:nitrite reductase (cytochrome c-552)